MDYYGRAEQPELARDFYRELRAFMRDAARRPGRYRHIVLTGLHCSGSTLRRTNELPFSSGR
jgi:hypothetical protein